MPHPTSPPPCRREERGIGEAIPRATSAADTNPRWRTRSDCAPRRQLMSYDNLRPVLERIKMTVGFVASGGKNTATVFDLEDSFGDSREMIACMERGRADPDMKRLIAQG